jgi:DNA polymerase III subunit delta'
VAVSLLAQVRAQEVAVATLRRALRRDTVHHAYLFDGPVGVGKEIAAFGLAQALVCERRGRAAPADDACGECSACARVPLREGERRPLHPDVAVLERALYEPAQIGRRTQESQDISIDQVRTLVLARAAFPPHEGRAKVFIVRRAEELSVAAANALLKTLEEPLANTHFILMSSEAESLLSTIRSRTQRVRFGLLPDADVEAILTARGVSPAEAAAASRLAGGSIDAATTLADPELAQARDAFVSKALRAIAASDMGPALELAEELKKVKGDLGALLVALGNALAEDARALALANDSRSEACAARYRLTLLAARQLDGNASAQLAIESMFARMRGV